MVGQMVKRLPTMREIQVQSLGREDLLEKEMATHSSILFFFFSFIFISWRPTISQHCSGFCHTFT